jgi:hypothetical protein
MVEKKGLLIIFRPISNEIQNLVIPFNTPKTVIITTLLLKAKVPYIAVSIILLFI